MASALLSRADEGAAELLDTLPEVIEAEQDPKANESTSQFTVQACCPPSDAQQPVDFQSTKKDHVSTDEGTETLLGVRNTAQAAGQRGSRPPTPSSEALADTGENISLMRAVGVLAEDESLQLLKSTALL